MGPDEQVYAWFVELPGELTDDDIEVIVAFELERLEGMLEEIHELRDRLDENRSRSDSSDCVYSEGQEVS